MSSSNTLNVSSGPLAEISVLNGSMETVARSVGRLSSQLDPGLYKVRVRNGAGIKEQLVSLDANRTIEVEAPPIFSPIPLAGTTRTNERHMELAAAASRNPTMRLGDGAGLFVFCREWSNSGVLRTPNPSAGLSIVDEKGEEYDLGRFSVLDGGGGASSAWCADAAPGPYRLRLKSPDGSVTERAMFASAGMQTQMFILLGPRDAVEGADLVPDLAGGAVAISPGHGFDPESREIEYGEIARYALAQKRNVLTDELRRQIVNEKAADPMLGLLGAHLLLRDEPGNIALFETVTRNLLGMLGPDHPDLRALCLRRKTPIDIPSALDTPPMLRASWDVAVDASFEHPDAFPESDGAMTIAGRIVPTGAWLVWRGEAAGSGDESPNSSRRSLQDYVEAKARLESARRAGDGIIGHVSSVVRSVFWNGVSRIRGETGAGKAAAPLLDADERAELARLLGIPASALNSILKKMVDK